MDGTVKRKGGLGFWVCNFAFTLERFSFYSVKWLIVQFLVASVADGGLGVAKENGASYQSFFVAFTYLAPLFGSYISDHLVGAKYLVPIGMALISLGYFFGFRADSLSDVAIMIALVSIGTGLFKPQTNSITGKLFSDPKDLDMAFSTQYSMVNLGSFIGTTSVGLIAGTRGYRICFLVCSIVMLVNAVMFFLGWGPLGEAGAKPFKDSAASTEKAKTAEPSRPLTKIEKQRVMAIVAVSLFSSIFWIFWYLGYLPVYDHWGATNEAKEFVNMNWKLFGFTIPTSFFDSENGLLCIALGPVLGMLWARDAKRPGGGLSIFKHTALGMGILGLAFLVAALAEITRAGRPASLLWVVAFGFGMSLGEMTFSPLGNSFISKFAPGRLLSAMMAVWTFAIFIAGYSYGNLYNFISKLPFAPANFGIAALLIVLAAVLWGMDKKLNSLIVSEEEKEPAENP
jgi:amino acid/peptide transporter